MSGRDLQKSQEFADKHQISKFYSDYEALALDDRIKIENAGNRHILLVNRLRSDDANSYMCYTINELGQAQDVIDINQEDITEPKTEHKYVK